MSCKRAATLSRVCWWWKWIVKVLTRGRCRAKHAPIPRLSCWTIMLRRLERKMYPKKHRFSWKISLGWASTFETASKHTALEYILLYRCPFPPPPSIRSLTLLLSSGHPNGGRRFLRPKHGRGGEAEPGHVRMPVAPVRGRGGGRRGLRRRSRGRRAIRGERGLRGEALLQARAGPGSAEEGEGTVPRPSVTDSSNLLPRVLCRRLPLWGLVWQLRLSRYTPKHGGVGLVLVKQCVGVRLGVCGG